MSATPRTKPAPTVQPSGLDPFKFAWDLLTNVKFALFLVGLALVAGIFGTIVPQVPAPMRGNAAARSAWLELQREDFGAFTGTMDRLQLFDIFHSPWFNGLWLLIIVAVTVCTVSRFRPTHRAARHPQRTVPDSYFERAHHRAEFSHDGGADAVEALLRRRRYSVERVAERDGATYLFADRFAWSHYGTFLSHLALLMLLIGALLTVFAGFDRTLVIAETRAPAPVFASAGPNQLFIRMVDAYRGLDEEGNIIDYHSMIEVRRGDETIACKTTVNDPCHAFGYKVHQAAWFNDIAHLRVEAPNGQLLYDDVLDFDGQTAVVPFVRVTNEAGQVVFEQQIPQYASEPGGPGREDDIALSEFGFPFAPGAEQRAGYLAAWSFDRDGMLLTLTGAQIDPVQLRIGEAATAGSFDVEFVEAHSIPAIRVFDMPGSGEGGATVQMLLDGDEQPYLFVSGIDAQSLATALPLEEEVTTSGGYTYTFRGQLEASGVSVRRDPGDTFIWVAVGMAIIGLAITFYVPRRRLWVRVADGRVAMAGIAEKTARFSREMRRMGHELGSRDALLPEDQTRES